MFLDEDGNAVIGDLGVARLANEKVETGTDILGTYRWMAPEVGDLFLYLHFILCFLFAYFSSEFFVVGAYISVRFVVSIVSSLECLYFLMYQGG